jgi:CheY-like chemotaxis protein
VQQVKSKLQNNCEGWNFAFAPMVAVFKAMGVGRMKSENAKPTTVLVVEDEPTVRALAESIIEALGYMILSVANAREAIAPLEQDEPIDILFTDINLPDGPDAIDGLELARKAVELCPSLRVIYTTGHGQIDGMTALFVEDAAFLPKPYRVKQLTEAVLATAGPPRRVFKQ